MQTYSLSIDLKELDEAEQDIFEETSSEEIYYTNAFNNWLDNQRW